MDISIGADPELFVRRRDNGRPISAGGMVPGTKRDPHEVENGAIQVDGCALEFNINPSKTADEFLSNIVSVLGKMSEMAIGYKPGDDRKENHTLELAIIPVAHFEKDYFGSLPSCDLELGCDPDYNAYSGVPNEKPFTDKPMRTASGHVHVGWTSGINAFESRHFELCRNLAKQLDVTLFLASLLWDEDNTRRELYGQPGSFRPKNYGMEYRVLSNVWLNCPEVTKFVFELTKWSVEQFFAGNFLYDSKHGLNVSVLPETAMIELEILGGPTFPWSSPLVKTLDDRKAKSNGTCC